MAERALRGTRLGATSYENDRNTDLAPRQEIAFDCPKGHHFTVPFAAEAEVPATWECRVCGVTAFTTTGDPGWAPYAWAPDPKAAWPAMIFAPDGPRVEAEPFAATNAIWSGLSWQPGPWWPLDGVI